MGRKSRVRFEPSPAPKQLHEPPSSAWQEGGPGRELGTELGTPDQSSRPPLPGGPVGPFTPGAPDGPRPPASPLGPGGPRQPGLPAAEQHPQGSTQRPPLGGCPPPTPHPHIVPRHRSPLQPWGASVQGEPQRAPSCPKPKHGRQSPANPRAGVVPMCGSMSPPSPGDSGGGMGATPMLIPSGRGAPRRSAPPNPHNTQVLFPGVAAGWHCHHCHHCHCHRIRVGGGHKEGTTVLTIIPGAPAGSWGPPELSGLWSPAWGAALGCWGGGRFSHCQPGHLAMRWESWVPQHGGT